MVAWIWVLIPIIAILMGGFKEWLKFKEKQSQLGTSTDALEKTVVAQQEALEAARRRIENLEAIVTSQTWDALHDPALPTPEAPRLALDPPAPAEPSDAERVAQMARRLRQ